MGLTESKLKDLTDKKFDKLFDKHKEEWVQMAKQRLRCRKGPYLRWKQAKRNAAETPRGRSG